MDLSEPAKRQTSRPGAASAPSQPPSNLQLIQTKTLPQAVQDQLLYLILSNQLKSGEKLSEAALAARLGVSRGPVREAFRGLEEAGLLRSSKNRGVYVREISTEEGLHLYDLRSCLEAYAGRVLAHKITDAQVDELARMVADMNPSYDQQNVDEFYPLNMAFHDRIIEMVGNPKLLAVFRKLMNEIHLISWRGITQEGGRLISNHEHAEIVRALGERNSEEAEALMRTHVVSFRDRFLLGKT